MPFPFTLPTTGTVLLSDFFSSSSHPSLPLAGTTRRNVLKDALKRHKRLPASSQAANLPTLQNALINYLPYLLSIESGTAGRGVGSETVSVQVKRPLEVEWRSTLSTALPGREHPRPRMIGLHLEISFVLVTLASIYSLLARSQLRGLYGPGSLTGDARTTAIAVAMKHLLESHSIYQYMLSRPSISAARQPPVDVQSSTISGLAALALAEATLVVVSKDDPYAVAIAGDRDESNTDWMFKAPSIPKVRAHLFARICLAAAEHATHANGLLKHDSGGGKIDEQLVKYAIDLRRTAQGKAARFLGIDAELSGKTGEGLAWLKGGREELGYTGESEDGRRKGYRGLKQSWQERREERRTAKDGEWGLDAGRLEEARVIEMLEAKWERENSTINVQIVPSFQPLLANMPSGREYHSPHAYIPPSLDAEILARMRTPLDPTEVAFRGDEEDSGCEDAIGNHGDAVGAFPGTEGEYRRSAASSNVYY